MTLYGACRGANRQNMVFAGTAVRHAPALPLLLTLTPTLTPTRQGR